MESRPRRCRWKCKCSKRGIPSPEQREKWKSGMGYNLRNSRRRKSVERSWVFKFSFELTRIHPVPIGKFVVTPFLQWRPCFESIAQTISSSTPPTATWSSGAIFTFGAAVEASSAPLVLDGVPNGAALVNNMDEDFSFSGISSSLTQAEGRAVSAAGTATPKRYQAPPKQSQAKTP